jgi:hypothetical protein
MGWPAHSLHFITKRFHLGSFHAPYSISGKDLGHLLFITAGVFPLLVYAGMTLQPSLPKK